MRREHTRKPHVLVRPLIGIAMLAASAAVSAQQPGSAQPQRQSQDDVRVALAPGAAPAPAQMTWNQVRIIHVKSDRVTDFEARIKELSAAMTKEGRGFNVWQVSLGGLNTYHIVSQLESFASLPQLAADPPMEQAQWDSWLERIRGTIDSQVLGVAQVHPDLSIIPQDGPAAPNAELLLLVTQTLLPGKRQEYVGWVRDQLLPELRKASLLGVVANEMAFGAADRQWVFAVPIQNWAELDKPMPLFTSMGQQAAEALLNRGDSMVEHSETIVLQMRPDLSAAVAQIPAQGARPPSPEQRR